MPDGESDHPAWCAPALATRWPEPEQHLHAAHPFPTGPRRNGRHGADPGCGQAPAGGVACCPSGVRPGSPGGGTASTRRAAWPPSGHGPVPPGGGRASAEDRPVSAGGVARRPRVARPAAVEARLRGGRGGLVPVGGGAWCAAVDQPVSAGVRPGVCRRSARVSAGERLLGVGGFLVPRGPSRCQWAGRWPPAAGMARVRRGGLADAGGSAPQAVDGAVLGRRRGPASAVGVARVHRGRPDARRQSGLTSAKGAWRLPRAVRCPSAGGPVSAVA